MADTDTTTTAPTTPETSAPVTTETSTAPETPKAPPSHKDWAAVTAAEKKARAIEARAKEEAKKLQADRQAFEAERSKKPALEALQEAYKSGNYDQIEKEFPDLYKKLTQSKLKAGGVQKPISEEALLAKFEAKQAEKEKSAREKAELESFANHESKFVYVIKSNKDKYPLLMIESEENPELVRSKLREIANGKEQMTYEAAADKLEGWLKSKIERRTKALGTLGSSQTKTEPDNSPNKDTTQKGQNKSSDGPTTISQRMTQESSLNSNPEGPTVGDEKSPTIAIRKRQEHEKAMMAKAIAEYNESIKKNKKPQD